MLSIINRSKLQVDGHPVFNDGGFECLREINDGIVVFIDHDVVDLKDGWLESIVAPLQDESVKMTYCDFLNNGVPIFHTSFPTKIGKVPLCAFRRDIVIQTSPTLISDMLGKVTSRYIPEILVEIYDDIKT